MASDLWFEGGGSDLHLVALLYRLRHAQSDIDWLRIHAIISKKLSGKSEIEVFNEVSDYYRASGNPNHQTMMRDFKALTCGIFYED